MRWGEKKMDAVLTANLHVMEVCITVTFPKPAVQILELDPCRCRHIM